MPGVFPAVLLSSLPPSMRKRGQQAAVNIIGSVKGTEYGVSFWRQDLEDKSKFVVVFRKEEDRERWIAESTKLKELKIQGVRVDNETFDRDSDGLLDVKMKGDKAKVATPKTFDTKKKAKDDAHVVYQPNVVDSKEEMFRALSANMEDLSALFGIPANAKRDANCSSPPPRIQVDKKPAGTKVQDGRVALKPATTALLAFPTTSTPPVDDSTHYPIAASTPVQRNKELSATAKEFHVAAVQCEKRTPSLRLPLHVTGEGGGGGRADAELDAEFSLIPNLQQSFEAFLADNRKKFTMNPDLALFIMRRNGLDLRVVSKAFKENPSAEGFKKFIEKCVQISEKLLNELSRLLLDFCKSKLQNGGVKERAVGVTQKPDGVKGLSPAADKKFSSLSQQTHARNTLTPLASKEKRDIVTKLEEITMEKEKIKEELAILKADHHGKLKEANQENKLLRAKISKLSEDYLREREDKDKIKSKISKILKLISGTEVECNNEIYDEEKDVSDILEAIEMLKAKSKGQRSTKLKLNLGSMGKKEIKLNMAGLLEISEVEKLAGRRVLAIKFKQARGKGWRTLTIENGLAEAPFYGWGDRVYIVDLDYGPVGGAPAFLGQGCGGPSPTAGQFKMADSKRPRLALGPLQQPGCRLNTSSLSISSMSRLSCNDIE